MSECRHMSFSDVMNFLKATPIEGDGNASFLSAALCSSMCVLSNLVSFLWNALTLLCYVLIGMLKLGTGLAPYLYNLTIAMVHFHRTQLDNVDILFEVVFILSIAVLYFNQKRILDYIAHLEKSMQKNGKLAAKSTSKALQVLPHIGLFFVALICSVMGRKFLRPLASRHMLPLLSLVAPVLTTVWEVLAPQLHRNENGITHLDLSVEDLQGVAEKGRRALLMWVVFSVYHGGATLLSFAPFSQYLLETYFPFVRGMCLVLILWAQLSPVFTEILFEAAAPVLAYCSSLIPSSDAEQEHTSKILAALRATGLIGVRLERFLRALAVEGSAFLILLVFACMPSWSLASIGTVILALLLPGIRAAGTIRSWEQAFDEGEGIDGSGERGRKTKGREEEQSRMSQLASNVRRVGSSVSGTMLAALRSLSPHGKKALKTSTSATTGVRFETDSPETGAAGGDHDVSDSAQSNRSRSSQSPQSSSPRSSRSSRSSRSPRSPRAPCSFSVGVFSSGRKVRQSNAQAVQLVQRQHRWLEYFVCIGSLWALRIYVLELWPSITMAMAWYLSHSLWNGATPVAVWVTSGVRWLPNLLTPIGTFRLASGALLWLCRQSGLIKAHGLAVGEEPLTPGSNASTAAAIENVADTGDIGDTLDTGGLAVMVGSSGSPSLTEFTDSDATALIREGGQARADAVNIAGEEPRRSSRGSPGSPGSSPSSPSGKVTRRVRGGRKKNQ